MEQETRRNSSDAARAANKNELKQLNPYIVAKICNDSNKNMQYYYYMCCYYWYYYYHTFLIVTR